MARSFESLMLQQMAGDVVLTVPMATKWELRELRHCQTGGLAGATFSLYTIVGGLVVFLYRATINPNNVVTHVMNTVLPAGTDLHVNHSGATPLEVSLGAIVVDAP